MATRPLSDTKLCPQCNKDLPGGTKRLSKFCSRTCKASYGRRRYREQNPHSMLPSATVGAIHELVVAVDLLRRGYNVFRALSPACPCDLAVLQNGKLVRVEVTTGHRSPQGTIRYPPKNEKKFDVLAIVSFDGTILYEPPFAPHADST